MSDTIKQQVALTALNAMMAERHFSICTIDNIAKMLGGHVDGEAYNVLRPLHCIAWSAMPPEVREAVPGLIQACLGFAPTFRFKTMQPEIIEVSPDGSRRSRILRLLGGGR